MAITYVGGVTGGRAGATSTTTQSLSGTLTGGSNTSPSAGDLVVVWCSVGWDNTAATSQTISGNNNGAYSNLAFQSANDTNDSGSQLNYKIMGSSVDTTITIPSSASIRNAQRWVVHVFRDVDATTPLDVASQPASGIDTGRPNPAAIEPVTAGAWIAAYYASAAAAGTAYTSPGLSGWLGNTTADTVDCMNGGGYYSSWVSGSYDPPAITAGGTTGTGDSWTAMTIALRPTQPLPPSVSDTITVSESIQISYSLPSPIIETITVAENLQVLIVVDPNNVSVFDAITVADVPVLAPILVPLVFDAVGVAENVSLLLVMMRPSVFSQVAVTEEVTIHIPTLVPSIFDAVSIAEDITARNFINFSVSDTITIVDILGYNDDAVYVDEYIALTLVTSVIYSISVNDTITVVDQVVSPIEDSVSVSESITMKVVNLVPSVFDAITISEFLQISYSLPSPIFDAITVSESITMKVVNLVPSVFDAITVAEEVTMKIVSLVPSVFDAVTVTEAVTMKIVTLVPSVSDTITVTENVTVRVASNPSVFDAITVTESVSVLIHVDVSVFEAITLREVYGFPWSHTQNFNDLATATLGNQDNWDYFLGDEALVGNYTPYEGAKSAKVVLDGSENSLSFRPVTASMKGIVSVAMRTSVLSSSTFNVGEIYFSDASENTWIELYFSGTGDIVFWNPEALGYVTLLADWVADTWYVVYVDFDVSTNLVRYKVGSGDWTSYYKISNTSTYPDQIASYGFYTKNETTGDFLFDTISYYDLVSVSDAITVTENVTLSIPVAGAVSISVSDTVTVTEFVGRDGDTIYVTDYPSLSIVNSVSVFDSISVAESVSVLIPYYFVSVFDAITVSESVTVRVASNLLVFDAVTITEDITVRVLSYFLVFDSISITENVAITVATNNPQVSVFDGVSLTEFIGRDGDTIYVGEYISIVVVTTNIYSLSVSDSVALAESVSVLIPYYFVSVFDAITVSESVTVRVASNQLVFDAVTVSESVTVRVASNQLVFDAITISESVTVRVASNQLVFDAITISESVTVRVASNQLVFDAVTVSESVTVRVASNQLVFDAVAVTDAPTVLIPTLIISVVDTITLTENVTARVTAYVSVIDTVSVAENVTLRIPILFISVFDLISIIDLPLFAGQQAVSVLDTVTVSENITIYITALKISVSDTVSITENFGPTGTSSGSVYESIVVSETVSFLIPTYFISVYDDVLASEVVILERVGGADFYIAVDDVLGVAEAVTISIQVFVSVFDTVSVAEQVTMRSNRVVSVFDALTVSESTTFFYPILVIFVYDEVSVTERESSTGTAQFAIYDGISVNESIQTEGVSSFTVFDIISLSERYKWLRKSYGYDINEHRPRGHHHAVRGLGDIDDPNETRGSGTGY